MTIVNSITQGISYIYQGTCEYCKDIPKNTPKAMVKAFALGFIFEAIFTQGNLSRGVIAGGLSALSTAIYGVVTPLFILYLNQKRSLSWEESMCRTFTSIIGASAFAAAFGNYSALKNMPTYGIVYALVSMSKHRRELNATNSTWFFFGLNP